LGRRTNYKPWNASLLGGDNIHHHARGVDGFAAWDIKPDRINRLKALLDYCVVI
jgi:hypothetical protein